MENVWSLFEIEGDEDIWTQVLKLSDETWKVPLQVVSRVLVVIEEVLIAFVKVTDTDVLIEIDVSPSAGEVDETPNGVVSIDK